MDQARLGPIRAVLFDFGGVLYRTPDPRLLLGFLKRVGLPEPGAFQMLRHSPMQSQTVWDIMTGKIREETLWAEVMRQWRISPRTLAFLRSSGYARRRLNMDMVAFLASLRPQYRTAILTNAATDFRQTFCMAYRLEELVDQVIISAEEGLCKPDVQIYQLAATRLGVPVQTAVFVDDVLENVEGAKKAGMQAVLYEGNQVTIRNVKAILED